MNRKMRMTQNLEAEIFVAFMETHGLDLDEYSYEEFMYDFKEDYQEYREWYMTCYA